MSAEGRSIGTMGSRATIRHGTRAGYRAGCRCLYCRAKESRYRRRLRERKRRPCTWEGCTRPAKRYYTRTGWRCGYHSPRCIEPGCRNPAASWPARENPGGDPCFEHYPAYVKRWKYAGWRALRRQVLAEEPHCRACGGPASEVDHIVPLSRGGSRDRSNLQALCRECHREKTRRENGGLLAGSDGEGPATGMGSARQDG